MNKGRRGNKRLLIMLSVSGMIAGIIILMYPLVMDWYNDYRNSQAISSMSSEYDRYGDNARMIEEQLLEARRYNERLAGNTEYDGKIKAYEEQLTFDGNGVMGYLEIPAINLQIIIYHGTDDETLAIGAGHLEGTSLPVGGESTHCVITAHSGMKNMRAFDNLRKMSAGDRFTVTVLGKSFTYETESIETVLPYETDSLEIIKGEDRITLVTCTPYGINDHRLLVHGIRVTDEENITEAAETADTEEEKTKSIWARIDIRVIPAAAAGLIAIISVTVVLMTNRRRRKTK